MNWLTPEFPPLIRGLAAGPMSPRTIALTEARKGVDAGLLAWSLTDERLRAALVLAPEEPLHAAMVALPACGTALQNALGTMVPPETSVHLEWTGGIRLNGGHVGGFSVFASTTDPDAVPDWMVMGLDLTLELPTSDEIEPGQTPDWTSFAQEGCAEVNPIELISAWARHTVFWINTLEDKTGRASLFREWRGLVWKLGQDTPVVLGAERLEGNFLGVDEDFGMLLKTNGTTRLIPLTQLIEQD